MLVHICLMFIGLDSSLGLDLGLPPYLHANISTMAAIPAFSLRMGFGAEVSRALVCPLVPLSSVLSAVTRFDVRMKTKLQNLLS